MNNPFVNFSEEEYEKYSELFNYNAELEDGKIRVWGGEDTYLYLVKSTSGDIYIEVDEDPHYVSIDGAIYLTSSPWWCKLGDIDQLAEDVKEGNELYWDEYEA